MRTRVAVILILVYGALVLSDGRRAPSISAAPRAQSPAPTEEATKLPYVFSTPIFMPTYADETPAPRATTAARVTVLPTGGQTYTVASGDSPWTIAQKVYGDGTKYPLIMSANNLTDSTRLRVGTVLQIPPLSGTVSTEPSTPTLTPPAPTPAPPTLDPAFLPPTAARAPTPAGSSSAPGSRTASVAGMLITVLNALTVIMMAGSLLCALLAFVAFRRVRRLESIETPKMRLRLRH